MSTITRSVATIEIRPAQACGELLEFSRWHRIAGAQRPQHAGRYLLDIYDARMLSSGLSPNYAETLKKRLRRGAASVPTVVAARTMALIVLADGKPIGGLSAGPSVQLCSQVGTLNADAALHAALTTIRIHALAIDPFWARRGIGTRLLLSAIRLSERAGARVVYANIDNSRTGLSLFCQHNDFVVANRHAPLDLRPQTGLPIIVPPRDSRERLCHRTLRYSQ